MGIVVQEADLDRDLPTIRAAFNANFALEADASRFDWLYFRNPDGPAISWKVVDEASGEIVGSTAVFPRRVRLAGGREIVRAWNCGDFNILPKYRTLGVAIKLRRAARDAVDAGVAPFLYAHPNDRMLQVHLKVGHLTLGHMVRMAKPLRVRGKGALVGGLSKAVLRFYGVDAWTPRTREVAPVPDAPGPEFDELDARLARGSHTALVRDSRYLGWRFGQHPIEPAEILASRARGRLTGYAAFARREDALLVKDWRAESAADLVALFGAVAREARRRDLGATNVVLLDGHPDVPLLRRLGYLPRPGASTAIVYAPEGATARTAVAEPRRWFMTVGDRDI